MVTKEELLNMKLHETIDLDEWRHILRVFGGWIYEYTCEPDEGNDFGVFVPEQLNCYTKES